MKYSLSLGKLKLKDLKPNLMISKIHCNFDNLLTGGDLSELLNHIIPDLILATLKNCPNEVSRRIEKSMAPVVEFILDKITIL